MTKPNKIPGTLEELKSWQSKGVVGGVLPDLDIDIYHHPECPGVSKSGLDALHASPAHFREYRRRKPDAKDWGDLGNAVHAGLLQPELFCSKYVHLPEWTTDGDGQKVKCTFARAVGKLKKAEAEKKGQIILTFDEYQDALGMIDSVKAHKYARDLLLGGSGIVEGSFFWQDPDTGILCKTRPDRLRDDGIGVDLKTTIDASPRGFSRSLFDYRYHVQAPWQMDGVRAASGSKPKYFGFVAVEKKRPYPVNVFVLPARAIEYGRRTYKADLHKLKYCQETDEWPCISEDFTGDIQELDLPEWAYAKETA